MATRRRILPIATLIAVAVAALLPANASAHARLKSSTPAVGEVLATSPTTVEIIFTNDIQKITGTYGIDVAQDGGPKVTAGDAVLDDDDRSRLSVALQSSLPAGRYVVTYTNASDEDGDPFEGAFAFYIGREPTAEELALDAELPGQAEDTPTPLPSAMSSPTIVNAASPTPADTTAISDNEANSPLVIGFALVVILGVAGAGAYLVWRRRGG